MIGSCSSIDLQVNRKGGLLVIEWVNDPVYRVHIFTIVFHFGHILFLQDFLVHLFFSFHMSDHHLAKGLSLSSIHDSVQPCFHFL